MELSKFGIDSLISPYLSISLLPNKLGAERMLSELRTPGQKWFVLTSTNALGFWLELVGAAEGIAGLMTPGVRYAAIGEQTAAQLVEIGAKEVLVPDVRDASSLSELMRIETPTKVVIPSGSIAMKSLSNDLNLAGFEVISEVVYSTEIVSDRPSAFDAVENGEVAAVLLRSPSAVRAFLKFHPNPKLKIVCGGNTTANQLRALGFEPATISADPSPRACAEAIHKLLSNRAE